MNTTLNTAAADIDTLGAILANIAALEKRAEEIKKALKDEASLSGQQHFDGATVPRHLHRVQPLDGGLEGDRQDREHPGRPDRGAHEEQRRVLGQGHHPLIPPLP
jgi:hypothetical protein